MNLSRSGACQYDRFQGSRHSSAPDIPTAACGQVVSLRQPYSVGAFLVRVNGHLALA